ncbi:hypothetical protein K9N68_02095 [Kovacikia minuta CCNUW1]|uniref:hypothetical protein n=1 Tax=Kovacikia minuta TaxID=2931930 RepID=UPI001CCF6A76|nr:hypothetical protein [Kovacikia minuta]UBF26809.1 hypothetical protein K9N68_02095 [Kovacikia minuta CCNUW1]
MMTRDGFSRVAATAMATMMVLGAIANFSNAQTALKDGDNVSGYVQNASPNYSFRNQSVSGAPSQTARGVQYTFVAKRGDSIEISVDPEDGSALKPILVLLSPTGKQVGYDATLNLLRYRVPTSGTYRLLVLGRNNTRGRYTLSVAGLSSPTPTSQVSQADQVMTDVLRLRVIGCGVPNVARIKIGAEERCTRDIEPGQYTYDETNRRITLLDSRRDLLAQRLQVNVLERCPSPATSVAQITLTDPQDGRDYTYCATPTRFVRAGTYRYNVNTDELVPTTAAQTPTTPTTPTTPQQPDSRRQILQNDYGLRVLDNCPAARNSLVVVSFPEGNQSYVYCANPNRVVTAGEYTYNASTGALDPARKPAPECTVSIGGVCLVK